jgi:Ni,Fe-hydrogenase III small subunit
MRKILLKNLFSHAVSEPPPALDDAQISALAEKLKRTSRARLGRSLAIRLVDAGSCNGCELEINALNNPVYALDRFGINFVASPRHADVLLVSGPMTKAMREALERTYQAMPSPKWVLSTGVCALNGGLFAGSYACVDGGVAAVVPVDLHITGCPPNPTELLRGLLTLLAATNMTDAHQ